MEYLAVLISVLALGVSFAGFYFSHLRKKVSAYMRVQEIRTQDKSDDLCSSFQAVVCNTGTTDLLIVGCDWIEQSFGFSQIEYIPEIELDQEYKGLVKPGEIKVINIKIPRLFLEKLTKISQRCAFVVRLASVRDDHETFTLDFGIYEFEDSWMWDENATVLVVLD